MTRITIDAQTREKLNGLTDYAEVCDESGQTLGYFFPPGTLNSLCPFSDEDFEEMRKEPKAGRPLEEILRDLERQA